MATTFMATLGSCLLFTALLAGCIHSAGARDLSGPHASPSGESAPRERIRVQPDSTMVEVSRILQAQSAPEGIAWSGVMMGAVPGGRTSKRVLLSWDETEPGLELWLLSSADLDWFTREDPRARMSAVLAWQGGGLKVAHPSDSSEVHPFEAEKCVVARGGTPKDGVLFFIPDAEGSARAVLSALRAVPECVHYVLWFIGE